tara:strand:+ start:44333 stop:44671 length:339 start_codon:yes stop_codon:yes gene_type:complete
MEFTEAEHKQVRDTLNKQRRLCEMYHMKSIMGAEIPAKSLGALAAATDNLTTVVIEASSAHDAATIKAATRLISSAMVIKDLYSKAQARDEAAAKAKPASKAKTSKAAKKKA